jgi:hypothetical protein
MEDAPRRFQYQGETENIGVPLNPARPVDHPNTLDLPLPREPRKLKAVEQILCKVSL